MMILSHIACEYKVQDYFARALVAEVLGVARGFFE